MNRDFDIEKVAQAIEADAGQELPELREALAEAKAYMVGRATKPPLTDADGEVRELSADDMTAFRPVHEALPLDVQESLDVRR